MLKKTEMSFRLLKQRNVFLASHPCSDFHQRTLSNLNAQMSCEARVEHHVEPKISRNPITPLRRSTSMRKAESLSRSLASSSLLQQRRSATPSYLNSDSSCNSTLTSAGGLVDNSSSFGGSTSSVEQSDDSAHDIRRLSNGSTGQLPIMTRSSSRKKQFTAEFSSSTSSLSDSMANQALDLNFELLDCGALKLTCGEDSHKSRIVEVLANNPILNITESQEIARLICYFHSCLSQSEQVRGLCLIVDGRVTRKNSLEKVAEAFRLSEELSAGAIARIIILCGNSGSTLFHSINFSHDPTMVEFFNKADAFYNAIPKLQLTSTFNGNLSNHHEEWVRFRMKLEPYVSSCEMALTQIERCKKIYNQHFLPSKLKELNRVLKEHQANIAKLRNEQYLCSNNNQILARLREEATAISEFPDAYNAVDSAERLQMKLNSEFCELDAHSKSYITAIEAAIAARQFTDEYKKILSWFQKRGEVFLEDSLLGENLQSLMNAEKEFDRFNYHAMKYCEKAGDIIDEASQLNNQDVKTKSDHLKNVVQSFVAKMDKRKTQIENMLQIYQHIDRAIEWALNGMHFLAKMNMDRVQTESGCLKLLKNMERYQAKYPQITKEMFDRMEALSKELENDNLLEQLQFARKKCKDIDDLFCRRNHSIQKSLDSIRCVPVYVDRIHQNKRASSAYCPPMRLDFESSSAAEDTDGDLLDSEPMLLRDPQRRASCFQFQGYDSIGNTTTDTGSDLDSNPGTPVAQRKVPRAAESSRQGKEKDEETDLEELIPIDEIALNDYQEQVMDQNSGSDSDSSVVTMTHRPGGTGTVAGRVKRRKQNTVSAATRHKRTQSLIQMASANPSSENLSKSVRLPRKQISRSGSQTSRTSSTLTGGHTSISTPMVSSISSLASIQSSPHEHETTSNTSITHSEETPPKNSSSCFGVSHEIEDDARSIQMETELLEQTRNELLSTSPKSWSINNQSEIVNPPQGKKIMIESSSSKVPEFSTHLKHVIAEMIQSERDYIASLDYIIVNYCPEVERLDVPQALRGKRNLVFGNVEKFYEFHAHTFQKELELYANDPLGVGAAFVKYESDFYMYALYNQNKPKCDQILAECGNSFFARKQLQLNDRMNLASYLLKPIQRLAKYALLLQDLMKHCPKSHPHEQTLECAITIVKFLLRHGNDLLALESLKDCDLELKDYGRLLRQEEFLVYQGRKKFMRHIFLFEDLLLFSKTKKSRKGHDYYQYKHSLKMQDIGLTQNIGESGYKFEIWFRKLKAGENYTIQAPTSEIKNSWVNEFTKLLWDQARKKRDRRFKEMESLGIGYKPFIDINPNEDQINDRNVNNFLLSRGSKTRNSIAVPTVEFVNNQNSKRPHSLISMSSGSSASTLSSQSSVIGSLTLANYDSSSLNSTPEHRRNSVANISTKMGGHMYNSLIYPPGYLHSISHQPTTSSPIKMATLGLESRQMLNEIKEEPTNQHLTLTKSVSQNIDLNRTLLPNEATMSLEESNIEHT